MRRFKSMEQAQRFLSTHAAVYNLFNLGRHLVNAENTLSTPLSRDSQRRYTGLLVVNRMAVGRYKINPANLLSGLVMGLSSLGQ